jgi:hypothetical protein
MSDGWAAQERAGIDLGDARLNKRSLKLLDRPAFLMPVRAGLKPRRPTRFLAQEAIGRENMLAPHFGCTERRMQGRPVVLCIQDTAELDFNGQQILDGRPGGANSLYTSPVWCLRAAQQELMGFCNVGL